MKNNKTLLFRIISVLILITNSYNASAQVVINEVMCKPSGGSTSAEFQSVFNADPSFGHEWVELFNTDPCNDADISCWTIGGMDGGTNGGGFSFPPGTIIPPLGHITVGGPNTPNVTFNLGGYPTNTDFLWTSGATRWHLPNGDGWLVLYDPAGVPQDGVYWTFSSNDPGKISTDATYDGTPEQGPNCGGAVLPSGEDAFNAGVMSYMVNATATGESYARMPDGSTNWTQTANTTPTACNAGAGMCNSNPFSIDFTIQIEACLGDDDGSITIDNINGGTGPFDYQWIPGGTSNSVSGAPGNYDLTITDNGSGCDFDTTFVLDPGPSCNTCITPAVTTNITNETCDGANDGSVEVNLTGTGTYNVFVDGNPVAAGVAGPTTETIPNIPDGTYSIQIVDATDPSCDTTFNININPGTLITITSESATDITDCLNPDGTFTVTATGATSYELYTAAGGLVASNATGSFTGLNAGDYYVVATDGTCTGQSSTLTINNASAPAAPVAGTDATYCDGDPIVDLTATAGAGGTLTWYDDAPLTNNLGTGSPFTPNNSVGTTIYYVTETVAGCESPATAVTITINPIPTAPVAGTDATYCLGDALADMTATAGVGGTLNWYDDALLTNNVGTGGTLTPNNTVGITTYYVTESLGACVSTASTVTITINDAPAITDETATDLTDCTTPNGTVTITSNGTSYELFDVSNNSITTNATGVFTGLDAGDYYVVVSIGNCTTTGNIVTVNDATASSSSTQNAQACNGAIYTFADGTTQTITSNTSYTSTLINAVGCDSLVTENITIVQPTTTIIDTSICEGGNYTSVGDAANFVNILADFQHTSTLTGASGCDSIIIENISVIPAPTLDLGPDINGCIGETITIQSNASSGSILWSTGDTTNSITVTLNNDITYFATVADQCGTTTDTINIAVFSAPSIDAGPDQTIPLGATVDLEVTSGGIPVSYLWSPSTYLSCSDCSDPVAGPTGTITYVVSGTDENGCIGYDTVTIIIDGEIGIYIPNIFSPNNDGENDIFKVYGPTWKHYRMEVYNRWGGVIYLSEDPNMEWDGTHYKNGNDCPQAVFVYKFWGVSTVGMTFERAGNVMLTR